MVQVCTPSDVWHTTRSCAEALVGCNNPATIGKTAIIRIRDVGTLSAACCDRAGLGES